jgi:hypothetical protein
LSPAALAADIMNTLYREIVIWRRNSDVEAVRYSCFENLETGRFCVQLADFIQLPINDEQAHHQQRNRVELFVEGQLESCDWHGNLKAAIEAHDAMFENFFTSDFPRASAARPAASGR